MRLLMRDLMRRYWWAFVLVAAVSAIPCFTRQLMATAMAFCLTAVYGGALLGAVDDGMDVSRVYVSLPLRRKALARFVWVRQVLLFPLVFVAVQVLGAAGTGVLPWSSSAELRILVCTALISVGAAGAILLFSGAGVAYPRVPRNAIAGMAQSAWGFALSVLMLGWTGVVLLLASAPSAGSRPAPFARAWTRLLDFTSLSGYGSDDELRLAIAVVLAIVSLGFIVLSYVGSARRVGRLVAAPLGGPKTIVALDANPRVTYGSRWIGRAWIWIRLTATSPAYFILLAVLVVWRLLMTRPEGSDVVSTLVRSRELPMALLVMTCLMLVGTCLPWLNAMRTLRTLPISTPRLTLFALSLPAVCFAVAIMILAALAAVTHSFDISVAYFGAALAGFGAAIFGCALFVAFGLIAAMLHLVVGAFLLAGLYWISPVAALIAGAALAGTGARLLHLALCAHNAAYRSKFTGSSSLLYQ